MDAWVKYDWVVVSSLHMPLPLHTASQGQKLMLLLDAWVIMNYTMCRPKRHSWKRYFCTRSATKFVWSVLNCMFSVLPLESFYSVFKILHDTMCPNQRRITWQSFSHSQPTFLHIIVPSWQLPVSMHQTGSLICNQHNKLMVKMTILFLRYIYIYDAASSSCRATIDL